MNTWKRGDVIELDGLLGVVVGVEGDPMIGVTGGHTVPDDHIAVWFGDPRCVRKSQGGPGAQRPEVWTVPGEYFTPAEPPVWKH
jgi:hypothetical protein